MTIKDKLNLMDEITRRNDERIRTWTQEHRANPAQRILSELRFARFWIPDILAGLAFVALVILLPIIAAVF